MKEARPLSALPYLIVSHLVDAHPLQERLKKEKWAELRERDVTQSVMGLKRQLHAEDFEKIFELRNPRIGER